MKIEDIYPYFSSDVPGCPDETMRLAVERVFRDMCARAKVWTAWLDDIQMIDNESTYDLDAPTNSSLPESILEVWVGSRRLIAKPIREVGDLIPDYATARSSMPQFFNMPESNAQFTVYPTPMNATLPLRVRGIFIPKRGITSIPDEVANTNLDAIEMGAKAVLMLQNKQQWSDPKMGIFWEGRFRTKLEEIAINQAKGNVEASDRVRPRRFGAY